MEEDRSFIDSGVGKAYNAWLGLSNDALELAAVIPFAFAFVVESTTNPDWNHINGLMGGFMACKTYDACKRSVDSQFETLHVLTLLASWGSFEAFVEDVAKAQLRDRPDLATNPAFGRTTRRIAQAPDVGDQERFDRIIDIVIGSQRDQLDTEGNGKYESQLDLAELSGSVPPDLAEALMEGQQVRNVWAHNGGRADVKLLRQTPNGGYEIGEKVAITKRMLGKYLLALNTYATIIVNRYRMHQGFAPLVSAIRVSRTSSRRPSTNCSPTLSCR